MATTSQTFSASGTFTWPPFIRYVTVECWGGGGSGGRGTGNPAGGGGGAGGTYSKKRFERPATGTDTVTVAALQSNQGADGNTSWFRSNDAAGCVAVGGPGGVTATVNSTSGAGGIATTTGCVGDVFRAGGNGGTGSAGASAGGGGEAANEFTVGNAGGVTTAGSGAGSGGDGGAGGNTGGTGGPGNSGTAPGGGGGGGRAGSTTDRNGGNGAAGQVIVSWDPQQFNNYHSVKGADGISVGERFR